MLCSLIVDLDSETYLLNKLKYILSPPKIKQYIYYSEEGSFIQLLVLRRLKPILTGHNVGHKYYDNELHRQTQEFFHTLLHNSAILHWDAELTVLEAVTYFAACCNIIKLCIGS